MNPYFLATFGIVAALGLVIFGITYFLFYVRTRKAPPAEDRCASCGLTSEMLTRLIPCKDHSGLVSDIAGIKAWINSHEQDYRRLASRLDSLADKGRG
jgi:hypothetical protein